MVRAVAEIRCGENGPIHVRRSRYRRFQGWRKRKRTACSRNLRSSIAGQGMVEPERPNRRARRALSTRPAFGCQGRLDFSNRCNDRCASRHRVYFGVYFAALRGLGIPCAAPARWRRLAASARKFQTNPARITRPPTNTQISSGSEKKAHQTSAISGTRKKSSGTTRVASPARKALLRQ